MLNALKVKLWALLLYINEKATYFVQIEGVGHCKTIVDYLHQLIAASILPCQDGFHESLWLHKTDFFFFIE